jgi:hypothetical protein
MSRQELANASGVSLRTISSFEDASDRTPTAANLAAIEAALRRLGVVFDETGTKWLSPFSDAQAGAIRALQVRNGPKMISAPELLKEAGCSLADLEALQRLQILSGVNGYPVLTAIGLHVSMLLRDYQAREDFRKNNCSAVINYTVVLDDNTVFHSPTASVFRIEKDGTLSPLFQHFVPKELQDTVIAGAREALRLHRERDPRCRRLPTSAAVLANRTNSCSD